MKLLRNHVRMWSLLVIVAIFVSPFARSFCRVVTQSTGFEAGLAAEPPCHNAAKTAHHAHKIAGKDAKDAGDAHGGKHMPAADCAACLALGFSIAAETLAAPVAPDDIAFTALSIPQPYRVPARGLSLGGLGSRAPPHSV